MLTELCLVQTLVDVEKLRLVRNEVRQFMTSHQDFITPEQQKVWWESRDPSKLCAFLMRLGGRDFGFEGSPVEVEVPQSWHPVIGYGLIRHTDSGSWITGALLESARGQGFGRQLFQELILRSFKPCGLDVLLTNTVAMRLYHSLGFRETRRNERFATMMLGGGT